jgi:hypothetical protein
MASPAAPAEGAAADPSKPARKSSFTPEEDVRSYVQETLMTVLNPTIEQLLHHVHESGELQRALREKAAEEKALQQQRERKASNPSAPAQEAGGNGGEHHRESLDSMVGASPQGGGQAQDSGAAANSPRAKKPSGNNGGSPRAGGPSPQQHGTPVQPTAPAEAKPYLHRRRTSRTGKDLGLKHGEKEEERAKTPTAAEQAEAAVTEEKDRFDPLLWLSEKLREAATGPTDRYREQIEKLVQEQISKSEVAIPGHDEAAGGGGEEVAEANGGPDAPATPSNA